ncbi:QcrA and Rieske domain-containing protein [Jiangella alkaliphila]|uniref:Ferredoxin subunit of nitrite reductase or a ring-hydroxylating dioxygenase n=1 Tax=Jiangella alkaliphila TaxID=419479 RepID=A0A1H2JZX0_9ACTN|nr:Rieske 2Fe-2S domain-containing protein [Jiangella alkaliphila]SDU61970.1 Ferredoxin subunit of nitrite reductase or a ring-hydroxylating dioxygenase [Jiangella alkaliphila]
MTKHPFVFVEDLLRGRRPRSFAAGPDDVAELRAAITLRAGAPDATTPSDTFVEALHDRLAAEPSEEDGEPAPPARSRRRTLIQVAAVAATSAAVGVAADRVLTGDSAPDQTLNPTAGIWHAVAASDDLEEGAVLPFDTGTVIGFLRRTGGVAHAVSGVCTHLGCRLVLNTSERRLDCPCHRSAFAVTGEVLHQQLPTELPALPRILVRETDGTVQVFVPPAQG